MRAENQKNKRYYTYRWSKYIMVSLYIMWQGRLFGVSDWTYMYAFIFIMFCFVLSTQQAEV